MFIVSTNIGQNPIRGTGRRMDLVGSLLFPSGQTISHTVEPLNPYPQSFTVVCPMGYVWRKLIGSRPNDRPLLPVTLSRATMLGITYALVQRHISGAHDFSGVGHCYISPTEKLKDLCDHAKKNINQRGIALEGLILEVYRVLSTLFRVDFFFVISLIIQLCDHREFLFTTRESCRRATPRRNRQIH